MFQHLLVPLDGSERAEVALPVAAHVARATRGIIHLVRVVSPPLDLSGGLTPVNMMDGEVVDREREEATTYLQKQASSPLLEGIPIRIEVLFGQPAPSLLEVMKDHGIDLLVLCSHGRTGFTRWVLGSVARTLLHQTSVPTLVLRQNEATAALFEPQQLSQLRALVPLDGSPLAETVLLPAAFLTSALAAPGSGLLHLSQVVKIFPTTAAEGFVSELNEEALQRAETYLGQIEDRLQSETRDLRVAFAHSVELDSDVASALVELAEQGKGQRGKACHLIAISTHGRGGVERWMMGSITERLLTATKLPLLVVRSAGQQ